ncbi:MAG: tetratricopeptide repeat protein [Butyrivibrio sp.]|nr:tetratricopeptide repeat protein [Acetatifactor muris]MCM1559053.1 tetratricopeptide repeat protein [Butyrivibrio sp.]
MFCYNCGCQLSEHDFCTACGADVSLYKRIMFVSNMYYNDGLEKAEVRDLTGAITSLRQSLKFNKNNIDARNLLGLVYFETGEVVAALSEWVISKNLRPEKNIADDYINRLQSNSGRLDSINQTIKKYNQALVYCQQDSRDLAVIQLKKVLSLNPRFIRAHQLLALLYMDSEQWERAERELRKCIDIDRNNTKTLRYLREVELMLVPDETVKQSGGKRRKDETVRYVSDNEMIIQPLNVKEPKSGGVSTLINIGLGLVIGLAVTYFLLVPAAQSNTKTQMQEETRKISNESDARAVRIQELESEVEKLNSRIEELQGEVEDFTGAGGTVETYDSLLTVAADYLTNRDNMATAADLENIAGIIDVEGTSDGFQNLYQTLRKVIGPELAVTYYDEAYEYFRHEEYPAAIESFERAVYYDETHTDALYYLARAYHANGNEEEAAETYRKVLELFPDSNRVSDTRNRLRELGVTVE